MERIILDWKRVLLLPLLWAVAITCDALTNVNCRPINGSLCIMGLASLSAASRLEDGSTFSSSSETAPAESMVNPANLNRSSTAFVRDMSRSHLNNGRTSLENNKLGTAAVENTDEPWPGNYTAIDKAGLEETGMSSSNGRSSHFILAMTSGSLVVALAIVLLVLIIVIFLVRKKGSPFTRRIVQVENPQYSVDRSQSMCTFSKENVLYDGPTVKFYFECDVSSRLGNRMSGTGGFKDGGSVAQPGMRSKGLAAKRDRQKPRVAAPRKRLVAETEFLAGKRNLEFDDVFEEEGGVDDDDGNVQETTSGKPVAIDEGNDHSTSPLKEFDHSQKETLTNIERGTNSN